MEHYVLPELDFSNSTFYAFNGNFYPKISSDDQNTVPDVVS